MMNTKICLLVLLLLLLLGCRRGKPSDQDTLNSGVIEIAVDETLMPLIDAELTVFEALTPSAGIVPEYVSETNALNLFLRDSVRFAVATRPLSEREMAAFNHRKFFPESIKIATDAIAIIVNKQNTDTLITVDALRKILRGEITRWDELFPRSPLGEIRVVFDHPNSSTVRYMLDSVAGRGQLSDRCVAKGSNQQVIDDVAVDGDALGIIGVNWISNARDTLCRGFMDNVRVMRVNNVQPYQYYIHSGEYPLTRSIYVLVNDPRSGLPTGLAAFMASGRGQRIVLSAGLLPATMPVNVVNIREDL